MTAVEEKIGVVTDYLNRVGGFGSPTGISVSVIGCRSDDRTHTDGGIPSDRASGCGASVARHRGRHEGAGSGPPPRPGLSGP